MATTRAMEEQQASNQAAYSAADNVRNGKSSGEYTRDLAKDSLIITAGNTLLPGAGTAYGLVSGDVDVKGQVSVGAGTASGAAAGAYAGSLVMPGIGTAIGAAVGAAVGAISSAVGYGHYKAAKAKKKMYKAYYNAAQATLQEREQNAQYDNYVNMVRQARIARAGTATGITTAGLETSSLGTSALSSIGSQSQYSMQYTANDQRLIKQYEEYMTRAKSAAIKYQSNLSVAQGLTQFGFQAAGAAVGGFTGGPKGAQMGMQVGGSVGNLATSFMQ